MQSHPPKQIGLSTLPGFQQRFQHTLLEVTLLSELKDFLRGEGKHQSVLIILSLTVGNIRCLGKRIGSRGSV